MRDSRAQLEWYLFLDEAFLVLDMIACVSNPIPMTALVGAVAGTRASASLRT